MDQVTNSERKVTILFALLNGSDNIESCLTLADALKKKDYNVVFAADKTSVELISNSDFEAINYEQDHQQLDFSTASTLTDNESVCLAIIEQKFNFVECCEQFNEELIQKLKPALIIVESMICSPVLTNSGIPWVWLNFGQPNICKNDKRMPPGWSGVSIQKPSEFNTFKSKWNHVFSDLKKSLNEWCVSKGAPPLADDQFHPHSPHLNYYVNPSELEYKLGSSWEQKHWHQIDSLLQSNTTNKFIIPEPLRSKPGKLVYLSMGPCASLPLMTRLTSMLSESKNKFIVSKGKFHDKYELPDNMWGAEDVPLKEVIGRVNLVITCGDTQAIDQCFRNAKPMIVMPFFGHQLDYRTRLREIGFGWGLDPLTCSKSTLICMIESILDDKVMARRLDTIADSIKNYEPAKDMANEIEKLLIMNIHEA